LPEFKLFTYFCTGFIDIDEVIDMFKDLDVPLNRSEALQLIKR